MEDAASAIAEGSLYIAVLEGQIIGAVTLRNKPSTAMSRQIGALT